MKSVYSKTFYKLCKDENGISFKIQHDGRLFRCGGYDFYITTDGGIFGKYLVTEAQTGLKIVLKPTLKEAQDEIKAITNNMLNGQIMEIPFSKMMDDAISQYGISPLYTEREAV